MQKILYAIQLKAAEDNITSKLDSHSIVPCGTAAYREAIASALKESSADILLYRESLKGSIDTFELMLRIRREHPLVRVVFIANEQSIMSKLLCQLVFLGIYDIIVRNTPSLTEIVDYILNPRDFGYANKFFHPEYMNELLPQKAEPTEEEAQPKTANKFFRFMDKLTNQGSQTSAAMQPQTLTKPQPQMSLPQVDLETMRGAMLEEARRTAQKEIPMLVESQVAVATASLAQDLEQSRNENLALTREVSQLQSAKTSLQQQLSEALTLRKLAEERMSDLQKEADLAAQHYQTQLTSLQITKPPEWYQEQTEKWLAERASYQSKVTAMSETIASLNNTILALKNENTSLTGEIAVKAREIEALQLSVPRAVSVEDILEPDFVTIADSEISYKTLLNEEGRLIVFLGAKHGVGNTTVALNTAAALANCGYKTCFIEMNRHFPMVNAFFEFTNITRGLDTALTALRQNNARLAMQCIIKPHGIKTTNRTTGKVYNRLPGPLHFLLYSNAFLLQCKSGSPPPITEQELKDLVYFLTVQERYSYIIVDLQPDDQDSIATLLGSGHHAHQLVMTLTQDPHSITTAGYLITSLARGRGGYLTKEAVYVLNQHAAQNKMQPNRICEFLHIHPSRLARISLDPKGYMDASYSMIPYILSKGKAASEYIDLRMKLTR